MSRVFHNAKSFNQDISKWDVSNVRDMSAMFQGATSFNRDISHWQVSSVGNMNNMFRDAASFKQNLCGARWVHSQATKTDMFAGSFGSISRDVCPTASGVSLPPHRRAFASKTELKSAVDQYLECAATPPGQELWNPIPWDEQQKADWRATTKVHRLYKDEVLAKIEAFEADGEFDVVQYGSLNQHVEVGRFPLFAIKTKDWDAHKPSVLVTGGVHGYETSGVQGALLFVQKHMKIFADHFNICVAPCVSPWAYERRERWTATAFDPNDQLNWYESDCEECQAVISLVDSLGGADAFYMHVDLHETTDADFYKFIPESHARFGWKWDLRNFGTLPDGFFVVGDSTHEGNQQVQDWLASIIKSVRKVTRITIPDDKGDIIGTEMNQEGVILYSIRDVSVCTKTTNSQFAVTTEVYPDSAGMTDAECNNAQVVSIIGALEHYLYTSGSLE